MVVKFFATLRNLTGQKECSFSFQDATLKELLAVLGQKYGSSLAAALLLEGRLHPDILILVNGRAIEHLSGLETSLKDEDIISIFPKMAGG